MEYCKRCSAYTLTGIFAKAQGISSSTFAMGQRLTSLVSVSASQVCGFTSLSCAASMSEAMSTLEFQGDVESAKNTGLLGDADAMHDALVAGITNWQSDYRKIAAWLNAGKP